MELTATTPMPDFLSKDEIGVLKRTVLKEFPEDEQDSFIRSCQRTKLDPFTKQIYATKRYQKQRDASGQTKRIPTLVVVTGIMGLTAVAVRTGQYDGCEIWWAGNEGGWREEWLDQDPPAAAKCIVYHKSRSHPEVAIARWQSFVGQTYDFDTKTWNISDFWAKMPEWMLSKCAKAAALRGAFPDQLSGVYIGEELESGVTEEITEPIPADESKYAAARAREAEDKAKHPEQYVTATKPAAETPEQVTEPAFVEDKVPARPAAPPPAAAKPSEPTDELDLGIQTVAEPKWKTHVLRGFSQKSVSYYRRKIGDLSQQQLNEIEQRWLPRIRSEWSNASDDQRADAEAFEAAIAFYKMQPPF